MQRTIFIGLLALCACMSVLAFQPTDSRHAIKFARSDLSMMATRKPFIAGNWKMNTELSSATQLAKDLVAAIKGLDTDKVEVAVIPPYPFLTDVLKELKGSGIKLGAQNAFYENKGAFTGAVSAPMLKSVGCEYVRSFTALSTKMPIIHHLTISPFHYSLFVQVLVGHSERRAIFSERDGDINHVVERIQEAGMVPVLCIGETKEEYELGLNEEICTLQLSKDLKGLTGEQVSKIVIAYEPVWYVFF
jgi:triosephosphate isomerase (TIM)